MTERDYFIEACFAPDLQVWYKEWIRQKPDRVQFFFDGLDHYEHLYWSPSLICRSSGQILTRDNIDISKSYWTPFTWYPIHKESVSSHKKIEAYHRQVIDCSCNDCGHLQRQSGTVGKCLLFNKAVGIHPNTCCPQNIKCFIHRIDYEKLTQYL